MPVKSQGHSQCDSEKFENWAMVVLRPMSAAMLPFLGEMQRIAFHLMLSSCVCVCVYAAFVDLRKTVWDRDVDFVLNCVE